MKYHLNARHEVKECRATEQECRFAENTPNNGHWTNYEEAEKESQKRLENEFSLMPSVVRSEKHNSITRKFIPLVRRGATIKANSARAMTKHDRDTSSITILSGTKSSDASLLEDIRSGKEAAFAR